MPDGVLMFCGKECCCAFMVGIEMKVVKSHAEAFGRLRGQLSYKETVIQVAGVLTAPPT